LNQQYKDQFRPRLFRVFVTDQYYANRDEYDSVGETQPYTFEQYVRSHMSMLKAQWRSVRSGADKLNG
jgi:hypothetical protein